MARAFLYLNVTVNYTFKIKTLGVGNVIPLIKNVAQNTCKLFWLV